MHIHNRASQGRFIPYAITSLLALVALIALGACHQIRGNCGAPDSESDCLTTCEYGGAIYTMGEHFAATDDCNSCVCLEDGNVSCTDSDCLEPACVYLGESYQEGESFPSIDGCNSCTCTDTGVACTELACSCEPNMEWYRNYESLDPEECATLDYACPENTTAFANACGCGCEQSTECPRTFSCMPPAECDVVQLENDCPYSEIAY